MPLDAPVTTAILRASVMVVSVYARSEHAPVPHGQVAVAADDQMVDELQVAEAQRVAKLGGEGQVVLRRRRIARWVVVVQDYADAVIFESAADDLTGRHER